MEISQDLYNTIIKIVSEQIQPIKERIDEIKIEREEFEALKKEVSKLTKNVNLLAKAQKRTEERVEELAQAQKRTEDAIRELSINVSGLGETIGFGLEDIARVMVPGHLFRHEGIKIEGELVRNFVVIDGKEIEIDLWGEGRREREEIVVVGEVKSRVYETDVKGFLSKIIEPLRKTISKKRLYPLMFSYFIHPSAQAFASIHGICLIASYQR
jgi:hypothetical protein